MINNQSEKLKVVVTGASRGIGRAIADNLSASCIVVGTATTEERARQISDTSGGAIIGLALDLSSRDNIDSFWTKACDALGAEPDILINNAGITDDTLFLRMKDESFDRVLQVNLMSCFSLSRRALKSMVRKRWGRVINISSVVASTGNVGQANYVAAKAGLEGLTRALAHEVAARGVTVNAIAPGFIVTDMTDVLPESTIAAILSKIPAKRMGDSAEVAALVRYLVSSESGYMTGQVLHLNGGMYMA